MTLDFAVRRHNPELVGPARQTPRETKRLSNIGDQAGLRWQVPFVLFYRGRGAAPAAELKCFGSFEFILELLQLSSQIVQCHGPNPRGSTDGPTRGQKGRHHHHHRARSALRHALVLHAREKVAVAATAATVVIIIVVTIELPYRVSLSLVRIGC